MDDADATRTGAKNLAGPAPTLGGSDPTGSVIGRYRLLGVIGEGGFGTVFDAEQREPVVRRVALKLIKLGMDTRNVIARFEAERQALALMDHPGIAKVFDAGATESGRPYFVMELVRGDPITEYCDRERLPIHDRLELFRQVCLAVQHAHQKGIIHRDIKPSNVLVTIADGRPLPKVIDFGIAKATTSRLTDKTLFTEYRQLIGTPEYMSPEQAEHAGVDIDTRSDVYSLGVLLYELLSGTTPFDAQRLRSAAYADIQRIIREEVPPKPSTRLSTIATTADVCARRRSDPGRLRHAIRGDLDWIVMKAMEKERSRRYETASALADDVERYMSRRPVVASPPSALYRARKFAARNRHAVAAGVLVFAALAGAAGVSSYFAVRERGARLLAVERGREAERQAARVQRLNEFLLDDLFLAGHGTTGDANVRVVDFLDAAAPRIPERFGDDPLMEAHVRGLLARMYHYMGRFQAGLDEIEPAVSLAQRAEGPLKEPYLEEILLTRATLLASLGRMTESEAELTRLLAQAEERESDRTSSIRASLASTLVAARKFDEAEPMIRALIAECEADLPSMARECVLHMSNLAPILHINGRDPELLDLAGRMIDTVQRHAPDNHAGLGTGLFWQSRAYARLGRHDEAAEAALRAADYAHQYMDPGHPNLAMAQISAAMALSRVGRHKEAGERALDGFNRTVAVYGDRHYEVERQAANVAEVFGRAGNTEEQRRWRIRSRILRFYVAGPGETESILGTFAEAVAEFGAEDFADRLEAECETLRGSPGRARFYANTAWALASHGRIERAGALLLDAGTCWRNDERPEEMRQMLLERLPAFLERHGRADEGEQWRRRLVAAAP